MKKSEIIEKVKEILQQKQSSLVSQLKSLNEDLEGETKSSMGDKYETSRSQLHLEIEKLQQQLAVVESQIEQVQKINFNKEFKQVENGALVQTPEFDFLIGIGLGALHNTVNKIFCISLESPIGVAMKGLEEGDELNFNNILYQIQKIV